MKVLQTDIESARETTSCLPTENINYKSTQNLFLFLLSFIIFTFFAAFPAPALAELQGEGTPDAPYLIATADDLDEFRDIVNGSGDYDGIANLNAHAKLTADIDLSQLTDEAQKSNWTPIGPYYSNPYTGTFDGCGYTISNLSINGEWNSAGLFGYVGGTVKNLTVSGSVTADSCSYAGGIAGTIYMNNSGSVENCVSHCNVSGGDSNGGIVGYVYSGGTVKNCINYGTVSNGDFNGGIVGYVYSGGPVKNCINYGTVSSTIYGGVVGCNHIGTVKNCAYQNGTAEKGIGNEDDGNGVVSSVDAAALNSAVASLSLPSSTVDVNGTAEIAFILSPAMSNNGAAPVGAFDIETGAVRAVEGTEMFTFGEEGIVDASYSNGIITLTGKAVGTTTMTVTVSFHPTQLDSLTSNDDTNSDTTLQPQYVGDEDAQVLTFSVPVNVKTVAPSGTSGSTGGGGGGGCSAGFGALALLAAVPLLLRRKK